MYMGTVCGRESERKEGGRKRSCGVKRMEVHYIYSYEDSMMKSTKHMWERGMGMGIQWRGELAPGALYACMVLPQ
jgi:hypothetical protein